MSSFCTFCCFEVIYCGNKEEIMHFVHEISYIWHHEILEKLGEILFLDCGGGGG